LQGRSISLSTSTIANITIDSCNPVNDETVCKYPDGSTFQALKVFWGEGFINPSAPNNFGNAASDISYLIAWAKQNKLIGNAGVSLVGMDYIAEPALEFSRDNPEELASLILLRPKFPEAELIIYYKPGTKRLFDRAVIR
jgi:hypothetical protein